MANFHGCRRRRSISVPGRRSMRRTERTRPTDSKALRSPAHGLRRTQPPKRPRTRARRHSRTGWPVRSRSRACWRRSAPSPLGAQALSTGEGSGRRTRATRGGGGHGGRGGDPARGGRQTRRTRVGRRHPDDGLRSAGAVGRKPRVGDHGSAGRVRLRSRLCRCLGVRLERGRHRPGRGHPRLRGRGERLCPPRAGYLRGRTERVRVRDDAGGHRVRRPGDERGQRGRLLPRRRRREHAAALPGGEP